MSKKPKTYEERSKVHFSCPDIWRYRRHYCSSAPKPGSAVMMYWWALIKIIKELITIEIFSSDQRRSSLRSVIAAMSNLTRKRSIFDPSIKGWKFYPHSYGKKIDHKVLTFVQEEMIMYEKAVSAESAPVKLYHGASILGFKFLRFIYFTKVTKIKFQTLFFDIIDNSLLRRYIHGGTNMVYSTNCAPKLPHPYSSWKESF